MLLFNKINWKASLLGEQVILLEAPADIDVSAIHQSAYLVQELLGNNLTDIVPAYHSMALFTPLSLNEVVAIIEGKTGNNMKFFESKKTIELPICYEEGLDFDRMERETGLRKDEIIRLHLKDTYRAVFIGFTPGFIYADGLDKRLTCNRLENPRKSVPQGSVGIGGSQTGIYSLTSPGGWNIIGRTPIRLFEREKQPPLHINIGDEYRFFRITRKEFVKWAN